MKQQFITILFLLGICLLLPHKALAFDDLVVQNPEIWGNVGEQSLPSGGGMAKLPILYEIIDDDEDPGDPLDPYTPPNPDNKDTLDAPVSPAYNLLILLSIGYGVYIRRKDTEIRND